MFDVSKFASQEMPAGRSIYKKGDIYNNFYFLEEGKISIVINLVAIQVTAPIIIGDYEILAQVQYRVSTIKTTTKCKLRVIPLHQYNNIEHYHQKILSAFQSFHIKSKVLQYWLKKLFVMSIHNKNDVVKCQNAIGIVLEGQFKHDSNIPIVKMKERNIQLLKKFEISLINPYEIFEQNIVCQSYRGITGILKQNYSSQLSLNFEEFGSIISVSKFKKKMHISLSHEIARNCRKKRSLFQQIVPITLKHSIQLDQLTQRTSPKIEEGSKLQLRKLMISNDVYSVKDNMSQFLHNQWRKGLSLKIPRKTKDLQSFLNAASFRRKQIQQLNNPQIINLTIPKQLQQFKFNFKMLLKTKTTHLGRGKRLRTQPFQSKKPKLLFQD